MAVSRHHFLALCLLAGFANAQFYTFCTDGIDKPDFDENLPVEVIFAQAPLFSTNPKVGQKLEHLNMYHSCLIFAQGAGENLKHWTLEFDYTGGNILTAIVPDEINEDANGGVSMSWHNDIRYCLSSGLKWGRAHWSKHFDIVTSVTVNQMNHAFSEFLDVANKSAAGEQPQYQLWKVVKPGMFGMLDKTLVPDVTCNNGAVWFLHNLVTAQGGILPPHFEFRGTAVVLNADKVVKVDMKNFFQTRRMVKYFRTLLDFGAKNKTAPERLIDFAKLSFDRKFVYDPNEKVYYELIGHHAKWLEFKYDLIDFKSPAFMKSTANMLTV